MLGNPKMSEVIKEATEKAGLLVTVALALSGAALLIAGVALVVAVKARH